MKAIGKNASQMRELMKLFITPELFEVNYKTLATLFHIPFFTYSKDQALFKADKFKAGLKEVYGNQQMENLPIKTSLQVTDMETGRGQILSTGNFADAIYASSAISPFFPPILIDGRWIADGGFSSNLPLLHAVSQGIDIIIAMDFGCKVKGQATDYLSYFNMFLAQGNAENIHHKNSLALDLHHYEIIFSEVEFDSPVAMWDTEAIPTVSRQGKKTVEAIKDQITQAIELFPLTKENKTF